MHVFWGDVISCLVFAMMRNELSFLYLRFPFSVAIGLCGKSLRCVSFVTTAWMECLVFFLISERERERESEEKVYYCCARQILPCFARDYLCLSMCACIRSIHVYMRVRLCSGMYSDVVVAVCCYYGGFFLYISLYSLGFLRYNFFFSF